MSAQSGSRRKRIARTAEEADTYSSWRRVYCYLARPGATAQVKRRTNRRERRDAKTALRHGEE